MAKDLLTFYAGASVALGILAFVGTEPALAQCLGPGVNFGGKNNGWTTAPCSRGGFGGGGGGGNAAAGLGAGAAALGALGSLMESAAEAEREQQARQDAAEQARRRARAAQCHRNWQTATQMNAEGNDRTNHWDPESAIPLYERAISYLSICGDRKNIAIIQRNLIEARKQYAAVRPDNRVEDARKRYGDQNIYNKPNPFAAEKEPDCYWDEHGNPCHPGGNNPAAETSPSAAADADPNSLRNRLRRALSNPAYKPDDHARERQAAIDSLQKARDSMPPGADRDDIDQQLAKLRGGIVPDNIGAAPPVPAVPQVSVSSPPQSSQAESQPSGTDNAYDNYMKSQNGNSGGKNDGDLGHSGFSMSGSETRKEIDRLLAK